MHPSVSTFAPPPKYTCPPAPARSLRGAAARAMCRVRRAHPSTEGLRGHSGILSLSTQAKSRTFPHTATPRQVTAGTRARMVLSVDVPGGKRSRHGSAAGPGSLVRGRSRGSGVSGQWGFTAEQPGGPLRPRVPGKRWLRRRKGAPSPHTVEETFVAAVQPRALLAAREEPFRKKRANTKP